MADIEGSNGQRTEFKAVGRANVPGRLSYIMATGRAKFGSDAVVPDMLHAKFLRNPFGRVKIKSMDITKAKALRGVVDIVTWDDPDIQSMNAAMTKAENKPMAGLRGSMVPNEADTEDEEIGAVVVAVTEEICVQALKLIKVEWDVLPHLLDPREGLQSGAPVIRHNPKGLTSNFATGNTEAGFKEADQIIEFDWAHSLMASHIPNPNGSVAWWGTGSVGS
jgi:CO/xanthine dehydrogenase Mo-binding subunit